MMCRHGWNCCQLCGRGSDGEPCRLCDELVSAKARSLLNTAIYNRSRRHFELVYIASVCQDALTLTLQNFVVGVIPDLIDFLLGIRSDPRLDCTQHHALEECVRACM